MKVLILSCNTGQGHNAAGRALQEEFTRRGITCRMLDALRFAKPKTSRRASRIYVKTTTSFPDVFGAAYKVAGAVSSSRRKSPVYFANTFYGKALYRFIKKNEYDCIVMPHLFPAEAMTYIRRHFDRTIPCYGIATDYTCIPFWEETELDYYFVPPLRAGESFLEKGIPAEKLITTGIPVSAKFWEKTDRKEARERLHLPMEKTVFLVMTGSMGYGSTAELVEKLAGQGGKDAAVIVMTGRNGKLKRELESRDYGAVHVEVLPYTDQISLYMDACDVLLTKPGGLTSTEAAVKHVPMIHTKPIPGCETINAAFFSDYGMAVCAYDTASAAKEAFLLAGDEKKKEEMRQRQREVIPERAAETICSFIVNDLKKR